MGQDVTDILEKGYWASYNIPFFTEIYDLSGYPAVVQQAGVRQSYQMAPRAQIFRRDQGNVVDMDSMKVHRRLISQNIMRYNNYKHDPISQGDPGAAICSRFDLEPDQPSAAGCYDSKVTSYAKFWKLEADIINGPTSVQLPPFRWNEDSGLFMNITHVGLPPAYEFPFIKTAPSWDE